MTSRTQPVRRADQPVRPLHAAAAMAVLLGVLWLLEVVDALTGNALDGLGIQTRELDGLPGILLAPWLHFGWDHLSSNSLPFLVLGFLVLLGGVARWLWATGISVVSSGLTAWLLTPAPALVLGASGLVFGWLTYLLARGIWSRQPAQVVLAVLVLVFYGGMLWGVLPGAPSISWQAHLGGAVGGVVAAWWLHDRESAAASR